MKFIITYISILLASYCVSAETLFKDPYKYDSLEIYFKNQNYSQYFKLLHSELKQLNKENKLDENINKFDLYYNRYFNIKNSEDRFTLRKAYRTIGYYNRALSRYHNALIYYQKASTLVEDPFCLDELAFEIENSMLTIYTRMDEFNKAIRLSHILYQSYCYHGQSNYIPSVLHNLGIVYLSQNKFLIADSIFKEALKMSAKLKDTTGLISSWTELLRTNLYLNKFDNYSKQINLLSKILKTQHQNKKYLNLKFEYEVLQTEYNIKMNRLDKAERIYLESRSTIDSLYRNKRRREVAKWNLIGINLYVKKNEFEKALKYYSDGIFSLTGIPDISFIPQKDFYYPENTFIDLLNIRAQIYSKKYSQYKKPELLDSCLQIYVELLWFADQKTNQILFDSDKLNSIFQSKKLVGDALKIVNLIKNEHPDLLDYEKIESIFYYSKAQLLKSKQQNLRFIDALSKTDKIKFENILNNFYNAYASSDFEYVLQHQSQIVKILGNSSLNNSAIRIQPCIEYSYQDDGLYVLSNINKIFHFEKLCSRQELDRLYYRLTKEVKNPFSDTSIFSVLYIQLLAPLFTDFKPNSITIIGDGPVSFIPFELFKDENNNYLLSSMKINYYIHAYLMDRPNPGYKLSYITYSPQYNMNDSSQSYYLKYSNQEVNLINEILPQVERISNSINTQDLLKLINKSKLFHYAGHSIIVGDASYLLLENNYKLNSNQISNTFQSPQMVFLSACETAIGKWNPGDVPNSLTNSFFLTGSESVISSLWKINDESTNMIVEQFYRNILEGQNVSNSLLEAKKNYLAFADFQKRHPSYWAGLIYYGKSDFVFEITKFSMNGVTFILVLIIISIYLLYKKFYI